MKIHSVFEVERSSLSAASSSALFYNTSRGAITVRDCEFLLVFTVGPVVNTTAVT
jgi:hypothetical protein